MTLQERLDTELKDAMRNRDGIAKMTLRAVKTALIEASKVDSAVVIDDMLVESVIQKEAKRRRDAADEYQKVGQAERAQQELAELAILETYLPKQLTDGEIEEIVRTVLAEVGATSMKEMGKVMSAAMPKIAGRADGKRVSQMVRQLL